MDCEFVRDNLSSFHDGELLAELENGVQQHLSRCNDCARELQIFEELGELVSKDYSTDNHARTTATLCDLEELRRKIESRLESQSSKPITAASYIPPGRFALAAFIAMAASLIMVVGWWTRPTSHKNNPQLASAVIDFAEILKQFDGTPDRAIESLAARFPVKKVSNDVAEASLGFRPAANGELPPGIRLAATAVMELPSCNCAEGQCTCGPGGCNCAASVCQREDGSTFLVFEHCESQVISFGDLPFEVALRLNRELQLFQTSKQLAVSWVADHRRLTAIGLKGPSEAETLVAKLSEPQS